MQSIYHIDHPERICSPAFVIFKPLVEQNIDTMCRMAGDVTRLRPHCKTHKMSAVAQMKLNRGIKKYKVATFAEAEMMADCGATDLFLAYNLVGPNINRAVRFLERYPHVSFMVTADDLDQAHQLSRAVEDAGKQIGVLLDLNPGRDRTGLAPDSAAANFYQRLHALPGLIPSGFHLYDGHIKHSQFAERQQAVQAIWDQVCQLRQQVEQLGCSVPRIVCGGTPTFPVYAQMDDPAIELSPGTCVFHDSGYGSQFPDLQDFIPAVLLFTRVVSRPTANRITLDLGTKGIASDPPMGQRCVLPSLPDGIHVLQNEEHLVVETAMAGQFYPGDWMLAIPTHVCPCAVLYKEAVVISGGQIIDHWPIVARDRVLTI